MDTAVTHAFEMAGYARDNVLPASRVRPTGGGGRSYSVPTSVLYSPEAVDPLQAAGGFNSVVELAGSTCRQYAVRTLNPQVLDHSLGTDKLNELLTAAAPTGALAQILPPLASPTPEDYRGFRLRLALGGLTFADEETALLRFVVTLFLVHSTVSLPGTPTLVPLEGWDPTLPMSSVSTAQELSEGAGVNPAEPRVSRMMATRTTRPFDANVGSEISDSDRISSEVPVPPETELRSIVIGSFLAELRAPLIHRDEPDRCRTRVFADLRRASWTETLPAQPAQGQAPSDVLLVHGACFSNWLAGATSMLRAPLDLPLTPTLSLVGANQGSAPVPEISDFEVRAFGVFDASGSEPALAVAFDVAPGCHGVIEDVRHFIGPNGYGVISDEFLVDRVFSHRWNMGGFDRRLELHATGQVTVTRNGAPSTEDAILFGYQELLTLDHAAITTDSNARGDCIAFGGDARTVPTSVRLVTDGQTFGADQVDLGPAQQSRWGVNSHLEVNGSLDVDPEIRDFEVKAQRDGVQPIAAPFAFYDSHTATVTYARVEGVSRHVFFLGSMSGTLS